MISIDEVFGSGGRLSHLLGSPEIRPGQIQLATAIRDTLAARGHLACEAPTGTGKSLACLVPAALHALGSKKPLVIATHTLALQTQLISKDVPLLRELISPATVEISVLKGRGNYVCAYNLQQASQPWFHKRHSFASYAVATTFQKVVDYIQTHSITEREQIPATVASPTAEIWDPLKNDPETCLGQACPAFWRCSYYQAVRDAAKAHIIITNHALVMADLAMKADGADGILPDYDALILDEEHHIEASATKAWSRKLDLRRFHSAARSLQDAARQLGSRKSNSNPFLELAGAIPQIGERWLSQLPVGQATRPVGDPQELVDLLPHLERLLVFFDGATLSDDQQKAIDTCKKKLAELTAEVLAWSQQSKLGYAYWVTPTNRGEKAAEMAPIDIGGILKTNLFEKGGPAVICVSATLQEELVTRSGFPKPDVLKVPSPFNYQERAVLYVPRKAVNPRHDRYESYVIEECARLVEVTQGRALILFTARDQLDRVHRNLAPMIERIGYLVLKQGDRPNRELLQVFRDDRSSVLFGLTSFWEGVDVPGDSCQAVILVKLPFQVPDDPLTMARCDFLKSQGVDPFRQLFLPDAIVRFKQGAGRLIRTAQDRGVVAVLDSRLLESEYGQEFRKAVGDYPGTRSLEKVRAVIAG